MRSLKSSEFTDSHIFGTYDPRWDGPAAVTIVIATARHEESNADPRDLDDERRPVDGSTGNYETVRALCLAMGSVAKAMIKVTANA